MGIRESTPKPGKIISSGNAELLVENFSSEFRPHIDSTLASNVPMACSLEGATITDDLSNLPILEASKVYAFYENTDELYLTTIKAMVHYLKNREPWEDYDICIFDSSFNWCLAVSHEDKYVWVTKD
ncbi:MAG TPA: hypothetical protein VIK59_12140 [Verrucomicrobiae bacterium]